MTTVFRPHQHGLATLFGTLEAAILELVWEHQEVTGRMVFEALRSQNRHISYGAVKTVMERLVNKQILLRSRLGNQNRYRAHLPRTAFIATTIREIIESLVASFDDIVYEVVLEHLCSFSQR